MKVGDKIKMCTERTRYTVQAFNDRFIVLTKPLFKEYLYTIIDREQKVRGPVNALFGPPIIHNDTVDNPKGATELLSEMGDGEVWHVSHRNRLPLTKKELAQIDAIPVEKRHE